MLRLREMGGRLDAALEAAVERRGGRGRGLALFGFALLLAVGVASAGAAVALGGRSQEVVYATADGSIVAVEPYSGGRYEIADPGDGYATAPSENGGSRSLAYSVLRGEGEDLRGDAYSVDLVRATRARLTAAQPGVVHLFPEFSERRTRISTEAYVRDAAPNVAAGPSSGAEHRALLGAEAARSGVGLLGAAWISDDALYAWRVDPDRGLVPVAHDLLERRSVALERPGRAVLGPPAYHRDSNTLVYAERPEGAPLHEARLRLLTGTTEGRVEGAGGLGLYDPAPPLPALGGKLAVMWTDGETTGVGLLDPATGSFGKMAVETAAGARHPRISRDGKMVAAFEGDAVVVRELEGGEVVRKIPDAQRPEAPLDRLRRAGFDVPTEADGLARPSFAWRSFEDG